MLYRLQLLGLSFLVVDLAVFLVRGSFAHTVDTVPLFSAVEAQCVVAGAPSG